MSESPHYTEEEISDMMTKVLKIFPSNVSRLGIGTYSYVFGISDKNVIKVYHAEKSYRNSYIDLIDYFECGSFRESFFNPLLNHKNLFKYDQVHHDPELGLYKIGQRMMGTIDDQYIIDNFNENMFFCLLEDMTRALTHLHSYG